MLALAAARRRWGIGVGGGLLAALGFALALLVVPALASFVWDTLTWQTGSSLSHLGAWSEGIQSLVQHPLGIGLGASGLTAVRFGLPPIAGDNQYFQYSVELGVPGLLLYVAILGGIGAAGLKAFRFAPGEPARSYGALTAAAALGLALNGITTVALTLPFVSYIFFWLAGSTVALADGRTVSPRGGA